MMARRRATSTRRPAARKRRAGTSQETHPARFRLRPVRRLRALVREARSAARRWMHRAWCRSLRCYATWRKRQIARKAHAARQRQTAELELSVRSLAGRPPREGYGAA